MKLKKGGGLSKVFRAQIILCSPDCRHRASGFGICPDGFWFCFWCCLMSIFSSFGESMISLYHCKFEVYTLWLGSQSVEVVKGSWTTECIHCSLLPNIGGIFPATLSSLHLNFPAVDGKQMWDRIKAFSLNLISRPPGYFITTTVKETKTIYLLYKFYFNLVVVKW